MTLWFVFALMTAAAIFAVLWPLGQAANAQAGSDLAVYRDQLDEIERDRAAGLIGAAEADAARVEVSRRLIAAADAAELTHALPIGSPLWRRRALTVGALLLLPGIAAGFYLALGSPSCPANRWPSESVTHTKGVQSQASSQRRKRILNATPAISAATKYWLPSTCVWAASPTR